MTLDDLLIDKRIVRRNIEKGRLDGASYQSLLDQLPDRSGNVWRPDASGSGSGSGSGSAEPARAPAAAPPAPAAAAPPAVAPAAVSDERADANVSPMPAS
jgi:hypothetical protein